jgi:hypothetical protein
MPWCGGKGKLSKFKYITARRGSKKLGRGRDRKKVQKR